MWISFKFKCFFIYRKNQKVANNPMSAKYNRLSLHPWQFFSCILPLLTPDCHCYLITLIWCNYHRKSTYILIIMLWNCFNLVFDKQPLKQINKINGLPKNLRQHVVDLLFLGHLLPAIFFQWAFQFFFNAKGTYKGNLAFGPVLVYFGFKLFKNYKMKIYWDGIMTLKWHHSNWPNIFARTFA